MGPQGQRKSGTERLVQAIVTTIRENADMVERSLRFGRLKWSRETDGEIQVDLELNIRRKN